MTTPFDLDDLEAQREDRDVAKSVRAIEAKEDFAWFMGSPRGRRLVYGMLADAGIYRTSMATEPCVTAFNEGARGQGLKLLARAQIETPNEVVLMFQENMNAR